MSIPNFESTGMSKSCENLTKWAGTCPCDRLRLRKSTTLATLVEMINQTRNDPASSPSKTRSKSFTRRRNARSPSAKSTFIRCRRPGTCARLCAKTTDILVVSELRDLESIQLAVSAAETGHLVFGTMNTNNASQTISRIIGHFRRRNKASSKTWSPNLCARVITQQLIPKRRQRCCAGL